MVFQKCNGSSNLSVLVWIGTFIILLGSVPAGTVPLEQVLTGDINDDIAQAIASPTTHSNTVPNVSVILHSPVIVPAMTFPEGAFANSSAIPATTDAPREALAPEVFNGGFALVNGTPVFLHSSPTGETLMEVVKLPVVASTESPVPGENKTKESSAVRDSVMKAMEHLSNISQQQAQTQHNRSINSNSTGSQLSTAIATANTSSVSVVVVPLIQNAFDLVDEKNPSTAQLAAENPVVISQKNGTHTTLHVVVKRDALDHFPIADHNAHGPLSHADFLGGGLINPTANNVTSSIPSPFPHKNSTELESISIPLENAHGPLTDADFTTMATSVTKNLSDSVVSPVLINVTADLIDGHHEAHLVDTSVMLPNTLLPANVKISKDDSVMERRSSPIFFFHVPNVDPDQIMTERAQDLQTLTGSHDEEVSSNSTTRKPVLPISDASTVPSAPRVPLEVPSGPVLTPKPLPAGTFAFVPPQETANLTHAKLLRINDV